jgi:anaerobic carbon-monoxide dehydrogenase iron sulfur subunit
MNARRRTPEGAVVTEEERCIGCRACLYICPFAAPTVHPQTGKTMTCDLCADDASGPECVTACGACGALTAAEPRTAHSRKGRSRAAQARAAYRGRRPEAP